MRLRGHELRGHDSVEVRCGRWLLRLLWLLGRLERLTPMVEVALLLDESSGRRVVLAKTRDVPIFAALHAPPIKPGRPQADG